jgi:hypothetical protein
MLLVPPAMVGARGTSLINTLKNLDLTTNLQVCLDAGDLNSWPGSGQVWKDLSGNGNDFNLGSSSSSDSADPTFNGVAGRKSTADYFSYDGGDRFTLAAASPPSWQSGMHKAGGKFTILQWAYVGNLTGLAPSQTGFGCGDAANSSGPTDYIAFTNSATTQNALSIAVTNGANAGVVNAKSTLLVTNNAWQMISVAIDVDTRAILFGINETTETVASVGSASPSSADSHASLVLGAISGNGDAPVPINGCRIAATAIYTSALSASNLTSIFNASRDRFGV